MCEARPGECNGSPPATPAYNSAASLGAEHIISAQLHLLVFLPHTPQPLAHWALSVPRGHRKKTDATDEQLETLTKFKGGGGGCGGGVVGTLAVAGSCGLGQQSTEGSSSATRIIHRLTPTAAAAAAADAAESAYKCGVQVCFTLVLVLVGMNKP